MKWRLCHYSTSGHSFTSCISDMLEQMQKHVTEIINSSNPLESPADDKFSCTH